MLRPALLKAGRGVVDGAGGRAGLSAVFVLLLMSALATEWIGVHAIFGAFLLGAIIPHDSPLARRLCEKLEDVVSVLLLPAFFALTGMRTELGLVSGRHRLAGLRGRRAGGHGGKIRRRTWPPPG